MAELSPALNTLNVNHHISGEHKFSEHYHSEMVRRVREKVSVSEDLDHEEHSWLRAAGYEIHHEPVVKTHLPPEDSLHIAIMMPFIDQ